MILDVLKIFETNVSHRLFYRTLKILKVSWR